jgi:hydrogenase small subunit
MPEETVYDALMRTGISKRDFLKFCLLTTASLGLESSMFAKVVRAMQTKPRPPIYWLNYAACTCCTESLIKSSHPLISNAILSIISLDFMETIQVAAGQQAEEIIRDGMKQNYGNYILMVEGSVPTKDDGVYCTIAGETALSHLRRAAEGAKAILATGSCAAFGCVTTARPNPTGCKPIYHIITDKPVVNIPGCPPIADVIAGTLVYYVTFDSLPEVDDFHRPKVFYGTLIHDNCYRRAFFDASMFVEEFDDDAARKGWCLYKVGCRGPVTYNACSAIKWNEGVSFPIQSGHPCFGCASPGYVDNEPHYQHVSVPLPGFPTADKIGAGLAIGTALATGTHLVASSIRKATRKSGPPESQASQTKEE